MNMHGNIGITLGWIPPSLLVGNGSDEAATTIRAL